MNEGSQFAQKKIELSANRKHYYDLEERVETFTKESQSIVKYIFQFSEDITLGELLNELEQRTQIAMNKMNEIKNDDEHIGSKNLRYVIFERMRENDIDCESLAKEIGCTTNEIKEALGYLEQTSYQDPMVMNHIYWKICNYFNLPIERFLRYLLPPAIKRYCNY